MDSSNSLYQQIIEPIEDRMIRSVWCITRNPQDAEDAMQNALLAVWKIQHRISAHSSPQALILKMCIDAAYDVARRRGRERRKIEPDDPADHVADGVQLPWEEIAACDSLAKSAWRLIDYCRSAGNGHLLPF